MTLIDNRTRFIVQGVTGNAAQWHLKEMLDLGQPVLAGVQPGGPREPVHGVPVFQSVAAACEAIGEPPDASLIFVPAAYAVDAAHEAIASRIPLLIWIAEGVPVHDTMRLVDYARCQGVRVVGPNTPGIISPGRAKGGLMPSSAFSPGPVGMVSRSGTLSYETALELTVRGIGQSTFIGVGGDPVRGTSIVEALAMLNEDARTRAIVMIGEIGGNQEEVAAEFVAAEVRDKPVFALIVGEQARPGRRMGHAGAIMAGGVGGYRSKIAALERQGIEMVLSPVDLAERLAEVLGPATESGTVDMQRERRQ